MDSVVIAAAAEYLDAGLKTPFALIAVGGYGRRELFPHSDIDLLLLFESESDLAAAKDPIAECLRALWDAGLRASHSVRTIAECCRFNEQNPELHISLLDPRFLSGDARLYDTFRRKLPAFYQRHGAGLVRRLADLTHARHSKFNHTIHHLEPDVKQAPGGVRDIHLVRWLSQLTPQATAVHEMTRELEEPKQFLYGIRCFLHVQAGRDDNLLAFELQDQAAETLSPVPLSPEDWMRIYFQHARLIFQSSCRALECAGTHTSGLIGQFRDWRSRLSTSEFTVVGDRLLLRNPAETLGSPEALLRLFTFIARHGVQLSWDAQRRVRAHLMQTDPALFQNSLRWAAWHEFLSQPHCALGLRAMEETGFLPAAIPEWHGVDSLVVRDFYHRYTVDEHTFVAIEAIDALALNKPGTPARIRDLLLQDEHAAILRMALLLHDIGKGTRRNHVETSLEAGHTITERLRTPTPERDAILFLIEHHLDLSMIMQGRDLDDPATRAPPRLSSRNRRAPPPPHTRDLRRHQRRPSVRHDALASRTALACLFARASPARSRFRGPLSSPQGRYAHREFSRRSIGRD